MSTINNTTEQSPGPIPADVQALFGEPPILLNENAGLYKKMMGKFQELIEPKDFFEWWWVKELTDDTWELRRLRRFKAFVIENKREEVRDTLQRVIDMRAPEDTIPPEVPLCRWENDSARYLAFEINEYKKMDALISAAEQRRGRTLREVARYRKQIALQLRQTSDGLIEEPANSFSEAA
jgi:hypothetical protein